MFHTVARGDTLSQIAETYDTAVTVFVQANDCVCPRPGRCLWHRHR
jgi:LysM repeat protein